jgi:hypothetical protein
MCFGPTRSSPARDATSRPRASASIDGRADGVFTFTVVSTHARRAVSSSTRHRGIRIKRDCRVLKTSEVLASGNLLRPRPGHRGSTASRRPGLRGSTVFAHQNRLHSRHMRRRTVLASTAAAAGGLTYAHTRSAMPRRADGGPFHPATSHRARLSRCRARKER